jgi:2-polyprenyl-3-methyl-5-hydroxy-6-metoxy-1,4-benzoquinol methylase
VVENAKADAASQATEDLGYIHRTASASMKDGAHDASQVHDIFEGIDVQGEIQKLLAMFDRDNSPETRAALQSEQARQAKAFAGHWFQRIDFPSLAFSSTSDHATAFIDEGGINTLGRRLTSKQASILRPYPKWIYLKPRMPDVRGKSVLEVGSSNGFFSFRFAEMGAARVTGMEIVRPQHEAACWSRDVLGYTNVEFLHSDFLADTSIRKHDVVFCSEVVNHFPFPFYGIARLIALANEMFIFDTGAVDTSDQFLRLDTGWMRSEALLYHSFLYSDGLLLDFFNLIGVGPHRVRRYKAPRGQYHILYMVDTSALADERTRRGAPPYLAAILESLEPKP